MFCRNSPKYQHILNMWLRLLQWKGALQEFSCYDSPSEKGYVLRPWGNTLEFLWDVPTKTNFLALLNKLCL